MDDLTTKLQKLLSDPESMQELKELAAMLHEPSPDAAQDEPRDTPEPAAQENPLPDLTKLLAVGQALSQVQEMVVLPDTLSLSPADRRIILFADGSWALVDSTGALAAPAMQERLVLTENGAWRAVTSSTVKIPDLKELEAEQKKASSSSQTAPPPPADGSAVYHTIVSGDTLSGIAVKYHTTVNTLCNLNGISRNSILRPGKKLRVQ